MRNLVSNDLDCICSQSGPCASHTDEQEQIEACMVSILRSLNTAAANDVLDKYDAMQARLTRTDAEAEADIENFAEYRNQRDLWNAHKRCEPGNCRWMIQNTQCMRGEITKPDPALVRAGH